jgi:D-glycero-alpha-D-manno-heptose 1-phosphate guanylyltransferase
MEAIILAGGKGTRLRAAVPNLPKPLAPINGRPFLEHQMEYWVDQGVERFILSVGYMAEVIVESIGPRFQGRPVVYCVEQTPLGTGGGILKATELLEGDGPYLAMNGDTFFDVDLPALTAFADARGAAFTFTLFRTGDLARYTGMDVAADGRILSLKATPDQQERLANGGVYLIGRHTLDDLEWDGASEISFESSIIPGLIGRSKPIFGMAQTGRFIDIGIPSDYLRAGEILRDKP